ncbi:hypothetical protein QC763_103760 [Podospora pseudopauciseta]|uniref:Uncharacterized protein n=2 Tax=Podospora TaxID=5144 RepID=A0ABR0HXA0_9PEZI|nr:hypothetical protein QC763_103760 [Podospora pseudopauciseta]KAK4681022.1 hypothetical protein QC764_103760 [Podospora pseudoanserina]
MKGRPVDQLVYEYMFPKPRQTDPQNFTQLLQRYLVLEVRQEVHSFYGHLDTPEAKYPGLDYTNRIHRIRLSRWQWHRRLFRAFDGLRLTYAEIQGLTKWEGTRWAKERFEREQGTAIRDTTADGFPEWVEPRHRQAGYYRRASEVSDEPVTTPEDGMIEEESDEELESVGVALNERLRERVALRNISGDNSMPLDEEWENWLKNAIESGELHVADQIARFPGPHSLTADDVFPPRMMAAARAGHWEGIPDFVHNIIRQAIDAEQRPPQAQLATAPSRPSVRYHNARVAVYGPGPLHSRIDPSRYPNAAARATRAARTAQQGA